MHNENDTSDDEYAEEFIGDNKQKGQQFMGAKRP